MAKHYVGIDLGGTNLKLGLVSAEGEVLRRFSTPTEAHRGPDHVIGRMADAVGRLAGDADLTPADIAAVGLGVPGLVDTEACFAAPPEAPLPPEQPQCPAVDLDPLANKLDKIAELIEGLNKKQEAEPQKPLQDDVARDMATKAVGATAKLAEALDKTDKKIDTVDAKVNVIDEEAVKLKGILQESGSLRARMALRMDKVESELGEDASKLDKVRAYMKDYVGEKVTSIKERDASTRIMIWIALGAILFLFWDVRQKQKTGDPLAIEKMLGHLSDRLETSQIGVLRGMGALADRLDERLDSVGAGDTEVDKKDTSVKGFSEGTPAK